MSETSPFPLLLSYRSVGLPLRASAHGSSAASEAAPPFIVPSYRAKTCADHSPTDTALGPIGIATSDGIAWTTPGDEITLQLHLRFWKKGPQSEDLHTHTNPLELTVLITFDPSHPELNHRIVCRNNPVMYVDPSGHIFGIDDLLIMAAASAIMTGFQTDWNVQAMAISAGVTIASAGVGNGVGSYVGTATGSQLAGVCAGAAAGGATAGGLNAAIYGGNVGSEMLKGAAYAAGTAMLVK